MKISVPTRNKRSGRPLAITLDGARFLMADKIVVKAINTCDVKITCKAVAEGLGMLDNYQPIASFK